MLVLVSHDRLWWYHLLSVDEVLRDHIDLPVVVDWSAHVGLLDRVVWHGDHLVGRYGCLILVVRWYDLVILLALS